MSRGAWLRQVDAMSMGHVGTAAICLLEKINLLVYTDKKDKPFSIYLDQLYWVRGIYRKEK